MYFRINGSYEERNEALMEDSAAFGLGCTVVGIVQFAIGSSSIAVLNFVAQKQVINIYIILWTVSVDTFIIFILTSKSRVERCMIFEEIKITYICFLWSIEPNYIARGSLTLTMLDRLVRLT